MGWSGYTLGTNIHVRVNAYGGVAEIRGEALFRKFGEEVMDAICAVAHKAEYNEINPMFSCEHSDDDIERMQREASKFLCGHTREDHPKTDSSVCIDYALNIAWPSQAKPVQAHSFTPPGYYDEHADPHVD